MGSSNYSLKATTFNFPTLLNLVALEPDGVTLKELKQKYTALDGYPFSDGMKIGVEYFTKSGPTSKLKYTINKKGMKFLKDHSDEVVLDLDSIERISVTKNSKPRGPYKKHSQPKPQQITPPSPTYSPTAQEAMNLLSAIIDANEQARKALESVYITVEGYFTSNPLDNLPADAGPFSGVIEEMNSFRDVLEKIKTITEPEDQQGVEQDEPSQESLIG